jgi:hypothetical protein
VQPDRSTATLLVAARGQAAEHQEQQIQRVARATGRSEPEVVQHLEEVVDRMEIRITRSLSLCRSLKNELEAGRIPTIRSVFETRRQDHTEDPDEIAGVVVFREAREESLFGPDVATMPVEDRPKYGFASFPNTPTPPWPFGPVCFILNLDSADLRERVTLTPVDSSIPGMTLEEVGTLDHPLNAFARSSDALRAAALLTGAIPPGSGVRDNAQEGTPEAQIWGALQVTPDQVRAIMVEVTSVQDPELEHLRIVAQRQGIPLVVRVLEGGA